MCCGLRRQARKNILKWKKGKRREIFGRQNGKKGIYLIIENEMNAVFDKLPWRMLQRLITKSISSNWINNTQKDQIIHITCTCAHSHSHNHGHRYTTSSKLKIHASTNKHSYTHTCIYRQRTHMHSYAFTSLTGWNRGNAKGWPRSSVEQRWTCSR